MMKGTWKCAGWAIAVAVLVTAGPVQAQRGPSARGMGFRAPNGPNMGESLAIALENREELGLSQEQVSEIQDLKAILDGEVAEILAEMNSVRQNIRAGAVEPDEGVRATQALRGELLIASAPLRGRVQEILTVEQHNRLQPLVRSGRPRWGLRGPSQGRSSGAFRQRAPGARGARGIVPRRSLGGRGGTAAPGPGGQALP